MKITIPPAKAFHVLACLLCSPLTSFSAPDFYVATNGNDTLGKGSIDAPFATLERARQEVAKVNSRMGADIHVYVRGGTYHLTTPVVFGTPDSGTNGFNVIYQAYGSEIPVLSGGVQITQWTDAGGGVYTANVGTSRFRQLYVNDRRAIRARTPNAGSCYQLISWNPKPQTITVNASDVGDDGSALRAVEMVVTRSFQQNRLRVSSVSIDGSKADLSFMSPEGPMAFAMGPRTQRVKADFYFENSLSYLDEEDEWYLDPASGTLHYKPKTTEPIANSSIVIPTIDSVIKLQGTSLDAPVHNIHFVGLAFAHTTWNSPDNDGFVDAQAGFVYETADKVRFTMQSGVYLDKADSVRFEKNTFAHMGGQALTLFSACHQNMIQGNVVYDISGSGIGVDMAVVKNPSDPRMTSSDNNILDNSIFDCAAEYRGSVGIFAGYVKNTKIEHNEIANLPYTGITVGWGWTLDDNPAMDNSIQYNHIHHVVNFLQDGAGVYTLSKQPGTVINNNYFHDIKRSPWMKFPRVPRDLIRPVVAIYLDNGSSYMTASNNVILSSELGVLQSGGGHAAPAVNNTVSGNDQQIPEVVEQAGPAAAYRPSPKNPMLRHYWKVEKASGTSGKVGDKAKPASSANRD